MTLSIHVDAHEDRGSLRDQVTEALAAIGFAPLGTTSLSSGVVTGGTESNAAPSKPLTAAQKKAAEKAANEAKQGIQAGEERADPSADDQKQDAKDEAADTAKAAAEAASKAAAADKPVALTLDDVKKLLGAHVQQFGMEKSQEDVKLLLNGAEKLSAIPDTQKDLAAAIISIATAIEKNPRGHEMDGDGLDAAKLAALKPIVKAAIAAKA